MCYCPGIRTSTRLIVWVSFTEILPPDLIEKETKDQCSVQLGASFLHLRNKRDVLYSFLCTDNTDGKCIRALLLWILSKGLRTLYTTHFSVCSTMYMIWAKRMFRKGKEWQVGICIYLPQPITLPMKFQDSSDDTSFLWNRHWWRKLKWQTVGTALVFPKAMAQDGPVYTFT